MGSNIVDAVSNGASLDANGSLLVCVFGICLGSCKIHCIVFLGYWGSVKGERGYVECLVGYSGEWK